MASFRVEGSASVSRRACDNVTDSVNVLPRLDAAYMVIHRCRPQAVLHLQRMGQMYI